MILPFDAVSIRYMNGGITMENSQFNIDQVLGKDFEPSVNLVPVVTKVQFSSKGLELLAKQYLNELTRIDPLRADKLANTPMLPYFTTLLWLRINYVQNRYPQGYSDIANKLITPVLMAQILIQTGEAFDSEFGIKFVPEMEQVDSSLILSPQEMMTVSDVIMALSNKGLAVAKALPRSKDGNIEFMAFQVLDQQVLSYRRSHPTYAFLAHFVRAKQFEDKFNAFYRVEYGSVPLLDMMINRTILSLDGGKNV